MNDEAKIVERIRRKLPSRTKRRARGGLRIGIGDDAAVLAPPRRKEWVLSCDAFLENVHFGMKSHPPESVGYKSLARATSDLAAMGAEPKFFLLTLALPAACTGRWLDGFLGGMSRAAKEFGMTLAGGDTSQNGNVAISITVIGEIEPGRAISRAGAKAEDLIFVSGTLGRAQLGLGLILDPDSRRLARNPKWRKLLEPNFYPRPQIALGRWLAKRRLATSMIDLSDGLSTDLGHLCDASGVGAWIYSYKIPAPAVPKALRRMGFDPLTLALHGGDDYELLFTIPAAREHELAGAPRGVRLIRIGEITSDKGVFLAEDDGSARPLAPLGWDHFRSARHSLRR